MRKIPQELENPIDNIIISTCSTISPIFKFLNMTPNMLTTISFIIGAYSIKEYTNKQYVNSSILFALSYFFDCMDGFFARKYNMVTVVGDYYDHLKDFTIIGIIMFLIFKKYYYGNNLLVILMLIVLCITVNIQISCQEICYNKKEEGNSLDFVNFMKNTPKKTAKKILKVSRYFGCGTLTLAMTLAILYSGKYD